MPIQLTSQERVRQHHEKAAPGHGRFGVKATVIDPDVDGDQRLIKAWVSTTEPDQCGEVVVPAGADTSYFPDRIKAVYLDHQYNLPIGVCRRFTAKRNGLWAQTYIARTELGDETLTLVREGVIGGMSIGFREVNAGPPTPEETALYGSKTKRVIREYSLVEYSLTPMPMNQGALIEKNLRNKVSRELLDTLGLDTSVKRTVVELSQPRKIQPAGQVGVEPRVIAV